MKQVAVIGGGPAGLMAAGLGTETFVGTSGRVFPNVMKASPLLRAWLRRLEAQGVRLLTRHRWTGFDGDGYRVETPDGAIKIRPDAVLLALGGASRAWPFCRRRDAGLGGADRRLPAYCVSCHGAGRRNRHRNVPGKTIMARLFVRFAVSCQSLFRISGSDALGGIGPGLACAGDGAASASVATSFPTADRARQAPCLTESRSGEKMFVLSKLFWVFAQPLSLSFLFSLFAAILAFLGWNRLGGTSALLAAGILFVTLFTSAGTVALQVLEARFPKPASDPAEISCMIVLGGAFDNEINTARGGIELNQAADRFIEALRLARNHPQARILVSGGDGSISAGYEGEAETAERFFSAFGIPSERLVKENTSRTTYENSLNTAELLTARQLENCLLITSAFHMPRSVGLFRKAGIAPTPWPVDYRTSGVAGLSLDFTQPALNAQITTTATREWMSLAVYSLTGRIGSLFPG